MKASTPSTSFTQPCSRSKGCPDYSDDKQEMKQCLFGLHLLHRYEEPRIAQTVNLVESEKTAIIMAIAYGNNSQSMWMATGGMENLTAEKLAPIIQARKRLCAGLTGTG